MKIGRFAVPIFIQSAVYRGVLVTTLSCAALIDTAAAQVDAGNPANVERFERQLEQIRRETRLEVTRDVPAGQRALIDYGGYLTPSYLSFDDQIDKNHAYRGYELVGYGQLNFDGAHELYLRGRAT